MLRRDAVAAEGLGHVVGAGQVDADDPGEVLRVLLVRRGGVADTGVVHQDVHITELLDRRVDQGIAVLDLGDVGRDGDAAAPDRVDLAFDLLEAVDATGAEHHVGTGVSQGLGETGTEAGGGAGDDGDLPVKPELIQHTHGSSNPLEWGR